MLARNQFLATGLFLYSQLRKIPTFYLIFWCENFHTKKLGEILVFYTVPTRGFMIYSGGTERDQWHEMG